MGLPYPGMNFTPLDPLSASELNNIVANINGLQDWSAFDAGSFNAGLMGAASIPASVLEAGGSSTGILKSQFNTAAGQLGGEWQTWTPTMTVAGPMTISAVSILVARYIQIGKIVFFEFSATFTLSGSATANVNFTPPVAAKSGAGRCVGTYFDTAVGVLAGVIEASPVRVVTWRYNAGNWPTGSSRTMAVAGSYEAA